MLYSETTRLELEGTADLSVLFVNELSHLAGQVENPILPALRGGYHHVRWTGVVRQALCQAAGLASHSPELLMFYSEDLKTLCSAGNLTGITRIKL